MYSTIGPCPGGEIESKIVWSKSSTVVLRSAGKYARNGMFPVHRSRWEIRNAHASNNECGEFKERV